MLYIFHHVFKTGGTSFNLSYLPAAFEPDEVFVLRGSAGQNGEDLDRAVGFATGERNRLKLIAGHNTGELRPHYPGARFLSLVREPVSRTVSSYLHSRYHEDAWEISGRRIQEENVDLSSFVEANWFGKERNLQSRLLLGLEFIQNGPATDVAMTERIRQRFHLIGYTEAFELFLFYLHVTEGFPLVLFNNRLVRKERATFQTTAADVAVIERYNQFDRDLCRCARAEFDRKTAEIWTSELDGMYQRYLEALDSYRQETQGDPNAAPLRWEFPVDRALGRSSRA